MARPFIFFTIDTGKNAQCAYLKYQPPICEELLGNMQSKCVICVLHLGDVGASPHTPVMKS